MNNRIIFCSHPDLVTGNAVGIKNYNNSIIKQILNQCEHNQTFYLIDQDAPNEWLNHVQKQVTIIHDCSTVSVEEILDNGKK